MIPCRLPAHEHCQLRLMERPSRPEAFLLEIGPGSLCRWSLPPGLPSKQFNDVIAREPIQFQHWLAMPAKINILQPETWQRKLPLAEIESSEKEIVNASGHTLFLFHREFGMSTTELYFTYPSTVSSQGLRH